MTDGLEKDPLTLQEQFHKYSDLLKFENKKMTVSDKAKKLVEDYSHKSSQIKTLIEDQSQTFRQKVQEVFFSKNLEKAANKDSHENYTFSTENKSYTIVINQV